MANKENIEQKLTDNSENELEQTVRSEPKKTRGITGAKLLVGAVFGLATGGIAYAVTQSAVVAGAVAGLVGAYVPSVYDQSVNQEIPPSYRTAEQPSG